MALTEKELKHVQDTWMLGHGPYDVEFKDLGKLDINDIRITGAFSSRSRVQVKDMALPSLRTYGSQPVFDGTYGPVVRQMLSIDRCMVPDEPLPQFAIAQIPDEETRISLDQICEKMRLAPANNTGQAGRGNWKGCDAQYPRFHVCNVLVNMAGIASFLEPVFNQVLIKVQQEYAKFGCYFRFINKDTGKDKLTGEDFNGRIHIDFNFVQRSSGWIGLAIVGTNEGCTSRIWCRYLASYRPYNVEREWVTLILHELGHNCGRQHTRGGVMNPSIVAGLGAWLESDPSYNWLKLEFGGVPVPIGDPPVDDDDDDPEEPPTGIESRLDKLEADVLQQNITNILQQAEIEYIKEKIG